jgi:uncharacterized protein
MAEHTEALEQLKQLQALDARLHADASRLEDYTRQVAAREAAVERATQGRDDAQAALRASQVAHRELEDQLQQLDARIRKLETEGGVAGMAAVEKHKAEVSDLEDKGLEYMDTVSERERQLAQAEAALKHAQELLEEARAKQAGQAETLASTHADVESKSQVLRETLTEGTLTAYQDALERHPGSPLAKIADGFCGGCQGELTPQHAVQAAGEVTACPYCDRILLPPPR